jgi:hypothetical protein
MNAVVDIHDRHRNHYCLTSRLNRRIPTIVGILREKDWFSRELDRRLQMIEVHQYTPPASNFLKTLLTSRDISDVGPKVLASSAWRGTILCKLNEVINIGIDSLDKNCLRLVKGNAREMPMTFWAAGYTITELLAIAKPKLAMVHTEIRAISEQALKGR